MSQMCWFKKLSTVILIILANYYDFVLGRHACCTHFCITDDLEKLNAMITYWVYYVCEYYDRKNAARTPPQPPNAHLFLGSDNAANQAKNNYQFSWMVDYVEELEDHGLETIQQNFTAEQHAYGKGYFLLFDPLWFLVFSFTIHKGGLFNVSFKFIRSVGCRRRGWKNWRRKRSIAQL